MRNWQFNFIVECLLFIIWILNHNLFFAFFTLAFAIIALIEIFLPNRMIWEEETFNDKLIGLKFKGKQLKLNNQIKQDLKPLEICLVQALCGSDFLRECFNFIRIKHKAKNWNVLFKSKYTYNKDSKKLIKVSEEK